MQYKKLGEICTKASSNIAQKDILSLEGEYPIYGASGFIKNVDFYKREEDYIAIVKDGAGVGRVFCLPEKSSIIGTMQYIIPNKTVDIRYLYYVLQNLNLAKYNLGAAIPHIYFKDYQDELIAVPSIEQQKKVSDRLDKLEALISAAKLELEKLDELVKAKFVEMFGDPVVNNKGNKIVNLPDIAEYYNGLTYKPESVSDDGTLVLRSSNIQNGQLDFSDIVRVSCAIKEKFYVQDNDILMCSRNGSARLVGKVALIKELSEKMSFGAFMMIIRSVYYPYLLTYFSTDGFRRQIRTGATTTVNQITGNMLDKIKLQLPPIDLQNKFADYVGKIDGIKNNVRKQLENLETLKKSLMQEYFR